MVFLMYIPEHFRERDAERIEQFLRTWPFALLICVCDGQPQVTHLPLVYGADGAGAPRLSGHLALANPQARELETADQALAVFRGPHAYVSPSWYERPGVPTWNYAAVHVRGRIEAVTCREELSQLVGLMTRTFEGESNGRWDWPEHAEYFDAMLDHIVGFHLYVEQVEAKFKLGQNRSQADRQGVVRHLVAEEDSNALALAELMARV